jgi:hypothetical protein
MSTMDKAYSVEIGTKDSEISRKLKDLNDRHQAALADLTTKNDMQLKLAQETYRLQADQFRIQSEGKLNKLREQEADSTAEIQEKASKGKA